MKIKSFYQIQLNQSDLNKCTIFANDVLKTNSAHYINNCNDNPDILLNTNIMGKLGEIATQRYFELNNIPIINYPDFEIYSEIHKSFSPDMKIKTNQIYNIHIKTLPASNPQFLQSWNFKENDPIIHNPSHIDYLIGAVLHDALFVDLVACISISKIYKELQLPHKSALKIKCLYLDDFQKFYHNEYFCI
jgi:hypothetical protein